MQYIINSFADHLISVQKHDAESSYVHDIYPALDVLQSVKSLGRASRSFKAPIWKELRGKYIALAS